MLDTDSEWAAYRKLMKQIQLLISDEWLLYPLKETEARDLLEIADVRYKKASTIFCSQHDVGDWHQKIGESTIADAILDRIVHDSYRIVIASNHEDLASMRQRKGADAQLKGFAHGAGLSTDSP